MPKENEQNPRTKELPLLEQYVAKHLTNLSCIKTVETVRHPTIQCHFDCDGMPVQKLPIYCALQQIASTLFCEQIMCRSIIQALKTIHGKDGCRTQTHIWGKWEYDFFYQNRISIKALTGSGTTFQTWHYTLLVMNPVCNTRSTKHGWKSLHKIGENQWLMA